MYHCDKLEEGKQNGEMEVLTQPTICFGAAASKSDNCHECHLFGYQFAWVEWKPSFETLSSYSPYRAPVTRQLVEPAVVTSLKVERRVSELPQNIRRVGLSPFWLALCVFYYESCDYTSEGRPAESINTGRSDLQPEKYQTLPSPYSM